MPNKTQDKVFAIAGKNLPGMSYEQQELWYTKLCTYVLEETGEDLASHWIIPEHDLPDYFNEGLRILREFRDDEASVSR